MPTRPKQHQLEDISRRKFAEALPREWVFRDVSHDYGIDGEVEIFDERGRATGLSFLVQLKATEAKKVETRRRIRLRSDSLRYFKSRQSPVLIVNYDHSEERLFFRWAGHLDFYGKKGEATYYSFKVDDSDEWTDGTFKVVVADIKKFLNVSTGRIRTPIRVAVEVVHGAASSARVRMALSLWSEKNLGSLIRFVRSGAEESDLDLLINADEVIVAAGCAYGSTVHGCDIAGDDDFSSLAATAVGGIGLALVFFQQAPLASRIVRVCEWELLSELSCKMVAYLLNAVIDAGDFQDALTLIERWMTEETDLEAFFHQRLLTTKISTLLPADQREVYENFLKTRLQDAEARGEVVAVGAAEYSLANYFSSEHRNALALRFFRRALGSNPRYADVDYVYREMAACYFGGGRFRLAAEFYEKAYQIGGDEDLVALRADSLLFAGEYAEALACFKSIRPELRAAEWILKEELCEFLLAHYKLESQVRRKFSATSNGEIDPTLTEQDQFAQLESVLRMDLINPLANFNLGVLSQEVAIRRDDENWVRAYFAYLTAAFGQTNDVPAWTSATICSFKADPTGCYLQRTIEAAYSVAGDVYLERLMSWISANDLGDTSRELLRFVEEVALSSVDQKQKGSTLRFLGGDGGVAAEFDLP